MNSPIEQLRAAWKLSNELSLWQWVKRFGSIDSGALADLVVIELEERLCSGEAIDVEYYFARFPQLIEDADLAAELIAAEYDIRSKLGENVIPMEYSLSEPHYLPPN